MDISSEEFLKKVILGKDITPEIIKKSEKERLLWSPKENGAYNNCVRFVADAIVKFTAGLPSFSADAIKILYARNEEIWAKFEKQLDEICKLLKGSEGTQVEYKEFEIDVIKYHFHLMHYIDLISLFSPKKPCKIQNFCARDYP